MAMTTTTPINRTRCPLCLSTLEIAHVVDGNVVKMAFDGHTADSCSRSTLQRIRVLEEMHHRDSILLESQNATINDLGKWVGACANLMASGKKWLGLRAKRAEDLARLRGAFGTQEREKQLPLWDAESEVAALLEKSIAQIEMGGSV